MLITPLATEPLPAKLPYFNPLISASSSAVAARSVDLLPTTMLLV